MAGYSQLSFRLDRFITHIALGMCILLCQPVFAAGIKVLMLNSYHPQYQWTAENVRGVEETLKGVIEDENLFIEFMDSRRFIEDEDYLARLIALYRYKYQSLAPDIIISTDDFALEFLVKYRDQIFGYVPVVFNGVNKDPSLLLENMKGFTGIREGDAIAKNLQLIREIHNKTLEEIIVLGDYSSISQSLLSNARAEREKLKQQGIELSIRTDFSFESLLYDANQLDRSSAIFITAIHKDSNGRYFSYGTDIPDLVRYSKVPIYGMWGTPLMGLGVVGGYMNNPYLHGKTAALIAIRILNGEDIENIAVLPSANYLPAFDQRQLSRFSISESRLPADSTIHYKEMGILQRYWQIILSTFILISVLTGIIFYLSVQNRRRWQAESGLAELNRKLEDKVNERTRSLESSNRALMKLTHKMESLANTDDLTMIPNRRHGQKILSRLDNEKNDFSFCITLIDLDYFKDINDQYGHDIGDKVLQAVSNTIVNLIRPTDTLCRWGGEEFLLILPDTNSDEAYKAVERIRNTVAVTAVPPAEQVSISCGIASSKDATSNNHLIKLADNALYHAKNNGRNQSKLHQSSGKI